MGAEIDENNLPQTISDGKFVIGTYEGAVKIADYLAQGYVVDDNGNVYKPSQSGGSTGSSGGSDPTYSPKIEVSDSGIVTVNLRTPKAGDRATIAVALDAGYKVDEVRVTARNGSDIALTSNGNGIYTLTQPAGQVVIEVAFIHSGENTFFTDVPTSFWAYDEIAWAHDNGYANGTGSATFNPNSGITLQ